VKPHVDRPEKIRASAEWFPTSAEAPSLLAIADSGSFSVHLHGRPGNLALVGTARLRCFWNREASIVSSNLTICVRASNFPHTVLRQRPGGERPLT